MTSKKSSPNLRRRTRPLRGKAAEQEKARRELEQARIGALLNGLTATEPESTGEGEDCELHVLETRVDSRGETITLRVGTRSDIQGQRDKEFRAALVLERHYLGEREQGLQRGGWAAPGNGQQQYRSCCVGYYDGCRPINQLPMFPLEFHPEKDRLKREVLQRGNNGRACMYFTSGSSNNLQRGHVTSFRGRVLLDCDMFQQRSCRKLEFIDNTPTFDSREPGKDGGFGLSDTDLLICSAFIQGYSLAHKRWGHFRVSDIQDIDFNDDAFTNLVLPDEQKESIADRTRSPLLPVNSGQIIGPAFWVEQRLDDILTLATRWKALVLIDEADVFLQQRTTDELERNVLVSCLLRIVEYFDGIMFLTTNRFEKIDIAFKSRIHLARLLVLTSL
ncbi:hypothetical protein QBC38DRAFT_549886 [Podospora fimiseda]|uniref:ATPase AAA-type core domain-containing protein n=1 Tax=Podospora fimiseda TaxID=252190 RepID=A0AAN6YNG9_9PEZI|nr:hypothetical protein QBC38DRAFT_549886 [Podospora fimiseda]